MDTKLRVYRLKKGMTQAGVAQAARISERAYNRHETGNAGKCQALKQQAIAEVLGVKPSILFDAYGKAR